MADMEPDRRNYSLVIHSIIIFWAHTIPWTELHRENYTWIKQDKQDLREILFAKGQNVEYTRTTYMFWESWQVQVCWNFMFQCAGTKALAGETTGTVYRKVGKAHITLGLEGPDRPDRLQLTWQQWQSSRMTYFAFLIVKWYKQICALNFLLRS